MKLAKRIGATLIITVVALIWCVIVGIDYAIAAFRDEAVLMAGLVKDSWKDVG